MPKIINNKKGFKVIRMSQNTVIRCFNGGMAICDICNDSAAVSFYVAVLNRWLCPSCYAEWYAYAINYPSDRGVEYTNFYTVCTKLGLDPNARPSEEQSR